MDVWRIDDAISEYETALELAPGDLWSTRKLAWAHYFKGKHTKDRDVAVSEFRIAAKLEPSNPIYEEAAGERNQRPTPNAQR